MVSCKVGKHPVQTENDILFCKVAGEFNLAEIKEYLRLAELVHQEQGHCFLLSDISHMSVPPADTRSFAASWFRSHSVAGAAMFGNSLPARTLLSLFARGVNLVSRFSLPMVFSKSEAEARIWLDSRRMNNIAAAT